MLNGGLAVTPEPAIQVTHKEMLIEVKPPHANAVLALLLCQKRWILKPEGKPLEQTLPGTTGYSSCIQHSALSGSPGWLSLYHRSQASMSLARRPGYIMPASSLLLSGLTNNSSVFIRLRALSLLPPRCFGDSLAKPATVFVHGTYITLGNPTAEVYD